MGRLINRSPRLASAILTPGVPVIAAMIVTLLVFVAAWIPDAASAKPVKANLKLEAFGLVYGDGSYDYVFVGEVSPALRGFPCAAGRLVSVYRNEPEGRDTRIGMRRSNFLGLAVVKVNDPHLADILGDYYAKVDEARKRFGSRRLNCLGGRSSTITVSEPQFHRADGATGRQARARQARSAIRD